MEHKENKAALLLKTFYELVSAILGQCIEPEAELRRIMSDNVTGFGTGKHETYNNYEEFLEKIFKVFGKQLPEDSKLHFFDVQHKVLDTVGVVHCTYEINYTLDGVVNHYNVRRSTVFEWSEECWRAVHLHVSEPSAHLGEGESFPVEALKAQNEELKKQVDLKTDELHNSLRNLQDTQQQLIQAAKMASLGELTAGIAHEIQNPLNFVNNFSEVSNELMDEMNEELNKGGIDEAKAIGSDIKKNLEKINHHGRRADAIVKGMLQHSRSSNGVKEQANINALADEYFRLAYHGLRAKDKSFNATMKTEFDETLAPVGIIPQDIGRVMLNLVNNAFYAVTERMKGGGPGYQPTVTLTTKKLVDKVELRVIDNGIGIPSKVIDKIFQPFFTTKPTGQGTGLGLSLSYDIIKAHGGELTVEKGDGEGTVFVIKLPLG